MAYTLLCEPFKVFRNEHRYNDHSLSVLREQNYTNAMWLFNYTCCTFYLCRWEKAHQGGEKPITSHFTSMGWYSLLLLLLLLHLSRQIFSVFSWRNFLKSRSKSNIPPPHKWCLCCKLILSKWRMVVFFPIVSSLPLKRYNTNGW